MINKKSNRYWLFVLAVFLVIHLNSISQVLAQNSSVNQSFADTAVVLINKNNFIPVKKLQQNFACLTDGSDSAIFFVKRLNDYTRVEHFVFNKELTEEQFKILKNRLEKYDHLLLPIFSDHFNDSAPLKELLGIKGIIEKTTLVLFAKNIPFFDLPYSANAEAFIYLPDNAENAQDMAAQLIFGGIGTQSALKYDIGNGFHKGDGLKINGIGRFQFCKPEDLGLDSEFINQKIDSIANRAIHEKAFPGCQVLAAKDGRIFFHKTYGFHTYDSIYPVSKNDLYDFASVTKITASLPCIMKLADEGKINPDAKFAAYWPDFRHSNKKNLVLRDVLAHQAGLISGISFWKKTLNKNGKFKHRLIRSDSSEKFPVRITDSIFLKKNYNQKIYKSIKKSKLLKEKKYVYSDLSFILYPEIVKSLTQENFEDYLQKSFYKPLGANTLGFNPLKKFPLNKIVPTENDTFFRKKLVHGTVHDETASMMGGVSGHAGLFGTTLDLAKMMQMYLNMGNYGDSQYISRNTMKEFTRYQFPGNDNRRSLGFDKPLLHDNSSGMSARDASSASFGHSGFTGTFCWADPENGLLYIFMSNRVYPTRNNSKISDLNIRPSIHQVFYDALKNSNNKKKK